ncbi:hypothetical protein IGI04_042803 [Brassica rapa subsp. trilocularis]|uniref:Uncharacterized protein n=1 Tax=Brassica rapa subsp. trilocularis TaxID=1813537 RepID=A0ABQ7KIE7_BRACM|nr:hypothetical protein IGI04_042803 [Brassica rapa subsp. trilocularis]
MILAHVGCLFSTHRTSVGVRQHTQDVRGFRSTHIGRPWLSVCVHVFPSEHTGHPWLSISTHISTLVIGISTLGNPVDCLGDVVARGLSVQYTQDVRGCPPAHIGRPWVSVSTHRMSVCPSAPTGSQRLSVGVRQHTQDVRRCPSVHISARWSLDSARWPFPWTVWVILAHVGSSTHRTSVAVRVCPCFSINTHRTFLAVHQYTYQHAVPWTQHTGPSHGLFGTLGHPVDCLGDFGPRGLPVQYTQDVRGCPPEHTGRPWVSTRTHRTSMGVRQHTEDICGCPSAHTGRLCVSVSTHRSSVAVRVCPSAHTGRLWLSISTHISTLVLGLSTLTLPVDCSGDFGPCGLSVQYAQDVRGCPSAHTGRSCVSVSTHRTSVAVRVCPCVLTSAHTGRPWRSISTHISTLVLELSTLAHPVNSLMILAHDVRGCPPAHTGCLWLSVSTHMTSVAVRVCRCVSVKLTQNLGCPSLTHISTWVHWPQHAGQSRGLTHRTSVGVRQHTQDVRVCPSAHTGTPWLSVGVRQHTHDVRRCPSVHISARWSLDSARWPFPWTVRVILAHVGCLFSTQRTSVGVRQHTQDVRGCSCVSVFFRQHTQDVPGCPSVHISARCSLDSAHWPFPWTLWVILVHVGCLFSTHRTSVGVRQHTHDVVFVRQHINAVRSCPCVSVSTHRTSVCVRQHTQVIRGCPCVSVSTHRTSVAVHQYTYQHGDFGPCGLSVQYAQDVRGCPSAHTGRSCVSVSTHRTSVAVRVCPVCADVSTHRMSVTVHQYTYQHASRWTQHAGHSRGLFRTSVAVHQHSQDIHGCPCVSVCVRVSPSAHTGRLWLSISTHISTLVLGLSTLALPVDCSSDLAHVGCLFSTHRTSVGVRQHTQDVRVCPSAHTGRLWLSISTHISTLVLGLRALTLPVDCSAHTGRSCVSVSTHRTSVAVRVCPCVSVNTQRTSVAVHQYTYQHIGP